MATAHQRLQGKTALVTGASLGIGAAVARAFAREGANVVINHLHGAMSEPAEQLAEEIGQAGGVALALPADVSDEAQVEDMVAKALEAFGPIEILVTNAAINHRSRWPDISVTEWDEVMAVNLKGAFLPARAVYPGMRERGYGKIITVSSVTVELGATMLPYVVTKAGLIGFTRSLAREVGPDGIRVNCVMPGVIRTEAERASFPDEDAALDEQSRRQCLPYLGVASDLEGACVFLAGAESDFITGQVIAVDGGWIHH